MANRNSIVKPANDTGERPKVKGDKRRALRRWLNRLTWVFIVLAPLVFIVAAIGYKIGLFDLGTALGTLNQKLGPLVLILCGVMGLASLIGAFSIKPREGVLPGVLGVVIAAFAMGKLLSVKTAVYETLPFIHDVTTDMQDPPMFGQNIVAERAAIEGVNTDAYIGKTAPVFKDGKPAGEALVSDLQSKAFPEIGTLILNDNKDEVFERALAAAKSMGWVIKEENLAEGRIDATDTTFWYAFEDDITLRLRGAEGGGTIVDVRSLSRIGGSDMGKNAERVREFLSLMAK